MSEEVLATERLERSVNRLEQAVTDRVAAAEMAVAERVTALEAEVGSLKNQLRAVLSRRDDWSAP